MTDEERHGLRHEPPVRRSLGPGCADRAFGSDRLTQAILASREARSMNQRPLGTTGLQVSELGFGGWQLGGRGWGRFCAGEARRALVRALELGINLFDTAGVYGFGRSEALLGEALRGAPEGTVVVSKGGLVWDDLGRVSHDNRPESLAVQLAGSLRRLRRDRLEVFLLHWPDPRTPVLESAGALEELRRRGSIVAWGLSNFPPGDVRRVEEWLRSSGAREGSLVLSYPQNLLDEYADEHLQAGEAAKDLLSRSATASWGFLAFDVLCRGLLGGRYGREAKARFGKRDVRSRDRRFSEATFSTLLYRAREVDAIALQMGVPPAALAIRAVLDRPGVSSCLVGMRRPGQVEECAEAARMSPQGELAQRLRLLASSPTARDGTYSELTKGG